MVRAYRIHRRILRCEFERDAFDRDGETVGALRDAAGKPISIDGLWSLVFGTFLNSDADTLYVAAGPNAQQNGLFGKIVAQSPTDRDDQTMDQR